MTKGTKNPLRVRETISAQVVNNAFESLAKHILEKFDFSTGDIALVGIQTRGVVIANRLAQAIKKAKNVDVPLGTLDVTLYRDDVGTAGIHPMGGETHLDFGIDDKQIILIDDVLCTGRTTRAAIDELIDFGRPRSIALAVFIDRNHRELPIQPDFVALRIATEKSEAVNLMLKETDGRDEIIIGKPIV